MKFSLTIGAAAIFALTACTYSTPINGELAGKPAQGTATASTSGGTFFILNTDGLRCDGTYDALTEAITITAPVKCNDGRTGTAIITRKSNLISGTVIARLSDGTTGEFVFGDIPFDQEF